MQSPVNKQKSVLYDKLHRFSIFAIFGVSAVAAGLFIYNVYLFKTGKYSIVF